MYFHFYFTAFIAAIRFIPLVYKWNCNPSTLLPTYIFLNRLSLCRDVHISRGIDTNISKSTLRFTIKFPTAECGKPCRPSFCIAPRYRGAGPLLFHSLSERGGEALYSLQHCMACYLIKFFYAMFVFHSSSRCETVDCISETYARYN